jgi:hypothetical protein
MLVPRPERDPRDRCCRTQLQSDRAREVPRALSLIKPLEREVGKDIRRLERDPVPDIAESLISPIGVHILPALTHLVFGEVLVVTAPDPESRYPAMRPATPDASEVVRAVPAQSGGEAPGRVAAVLWCSAGLLIGGGLEGVEHREAGGGAEAVSGACDRDLSYRG